MNPIRKRPAWVARFPDGSLGLSFRSSGSGRWVAICPSCGQETFGAPSRKVAKDRLHAHKKAVH